jgi:hypothetical protein
MRHFALMLAALTACAAAPSQHDASVYGTVSVALGPSLDGVYDWRPEHAAAVIAALDDFEALGPATVFTDEGSADVVIRAASLTRGCGAFSPGLRFVEVDAACASQQGGTPAVARAAMHELAHWYTHQRWGSAPHACRHPSDGADCHPTVTCPSGDCLLSQGVARFDDGPGFTEVFASFQDWRATPDDLALVAHCQAAGRCL